MTRNDCEIAIDPHGYQHFGAYLKKLHIPWKSALILSDQNVWKICGDKILEQTLIAIPQVESCVIPAGETAKNLDQALICWQQMLEKGLDRTSLVIALGGGVITDMGGFIASTYMRGIDLINIPTTLLSMVDAAVGGKNGVNLPKAKNIIGTLHHPRMVLIDPTMLNPLGSREFRSGLAEIIKYGVIWDPGLFAYLEQKMDLILKKEEGVLSTIISRSCEIKTEIVQRDEQEKGLRNILNWGHTFAHALETITGYTKYLHGEAVAIGMSCAANLSYVLGCVDEEFVRKQDALIQLAGLSIQLPEMNEAEFIELMGKDKKTTKGNLGFIIAREIGKVSFFNNVERKFIVEALQRKRSYV